MSLSSLTNRRLKLHRRPLCTWSEANPVAREGTLLPAVDELQGPYYGTEVCNFSKEQYALAGHLLAPVRRFRQEG
jgi:hypothetical protein